MTKEICKNCRFREDTTVRTMTGLDEVNICTIDTACIDDIENETCNLFEREDNIKND